MLVSLARKQSDRKEKLMWRNVGELTMVSVERSERVTRRRKVAIEQQKQEGTKRRKLWEQSGDRICDLYFESGASTSETTEEQLTDGMDTDNFCDGQGEKCKSKEFVMSDRPARTES